MMKLMKFHNINLQFALYQIQFIVLIKVLRDSDMRLLLTSRTPIESNTFLLKKLCKALEMDVLECIAIQR